MKQFHLICLTLLALLGACTKNEFTLQARLDGSKHNSVLLVYRAADKARSFLVQDNLDLIDGSFTLKGMTRYPTVVWVFSPFDGKLLIPVYAERGDELQLTGNWQDPSSWKVSGNEVMEEYGKWTAANAKALKAHDTEALNKAVAAYVKQHPDSRAAAFLLFTRYEAAGHEQQYATLGRRLKLDNDELEEMKAACLAPGYMPPAPPEKMPPVRLPDERDSLAALPSGRPMLLHFWRMEPRDEKMKALLRDAAEDSLVCLVNIFMDTDTVRRNELARTDSAMRADRQLWAPGGEVHPALKPLALTATPCLMVVDKAGKITYRGADPDAARSRAGL